MEQLYGQLSEQHQQLLTELVQLQDKIDTIGSSNDLEKILYALGGAAATLLVQYAKTLGERWRDNSAREQSAYDGVRNALSETKKTLQTGGFSWDQARLATEPIRIPEQVFEDAKTHIPSVEPRVHREVRAAVKEILTYCGDRDSSDGTVIITQDFFKFFDKVEEALVRHHPSRRWFRVW